jgi:hypothetical protein
VCFGSTSDLQVRAGQISEQARADQSRAGPSSFAFFLLPSSFFFLLPDQSRPFFLPPSSFSSSFFLLPSSFFLLPDQVRSFFLLPDQVRPDKSDQSDQTSQTRAGRIRARSAQRKIRASQIREAPSSSSGLLR